MKKAKTYKEFRDKIVGKDKKHEEKIYKAYMKEKKKQQAANNDWIVHVFPKEHFSYTHDKEAKAFYFNLNTKEKSRNSILDKAEVILDVNNKGDIVGVEILY